MPRCRIDETGTYLVKESGTYRIDPTIADPAARRATRQAVEAASVRPVPGTSDTLGRPLRVDALPGIASGLFGGLRLQMVESHDLTALAPMHLKKEDAGL